MSITFRSVLSAVLACLLLGATPTFNGNNVSATVPFANVTYYGAYGDGTHDDTTAIQNALNAMCPAPGGNALGYVRLNAGNYKITSTLNVQCANEGIVGIGAMAPTLSSANGTTTLTWAGAAGGTMINVAAPAGTGGYGNLSGNYITKVKLASGNGISGTGGAGYGIIFKGVWHPSVTHVSCDGFASWCVDLTYDTQFTVPGSSGAEIDDLRGESFNGGFLYFDGAYSSAVSNLALTVNNNTAVKFGDGTTVDDESDTVTVNQANIHVSGTGIAVDLSCNSSEITLLGGAASFTARGTTTCASRNGATYGDAVIASNSAQGYTNYNIENGANVHLAYASGQEIDYLASANTLVSVPTKYWNVVTGTPPPNHDRNQYVWHVQGTGNVAQDFAAVSNANGANHYTITGTQSSTCGGVNGTTWTVTDATATSSPSPSYSPNPSACVAVGSDGSIGTTGSVTAGSTITASTSVSAGGTTQNGSFYGDGILAHASDTFYFENGSLGITASINGGNGRMIDNNGFQSTAGLFSGSSTYATNANVAGTVSAALHNACSSSSGVPCETTATCSIASSTTCTGTATVPASSICTVTANASDTTTGAEWFKVSLATNTLTVTANVASSQTSTAAANVTCL